MKLTALSSAGGTAGAAAANALPAEIISITTNVVPYFDFASMGPALLAMLFLLLSVSLDCCHASCCTKIFIFLCHPFLLGSLTWNIGMLGAGVLADRAVLLDQWAKITAVCTDNLPTLNAALATATTDYADAQTSGASAAQLAQAQAKLISGQTQFDDFTGLCTCLDQVPTDLKSLIGAGLLGMCASLAAIVAVNGLCCANGCCRKPKKKVAPAADKESKTKDDLDESEEEEEEK